MTEVDIRIESASSAVAGKLIAALDADLRRRYPDEPVHGIDAAAFETGGGVFAVGYVGGEPAVCGAISPYGDAAEIKRMFVVPGVRGRGLGREMLRFLEQEAVRHGYRKAILETGTGQPEAISLYRSQGWRPTPTFGPYVGNPLSTCFEKRLDTA